MYAMIFHLHYVYFYTNTLGINLPCKKKLKCIPLEFKALVMSVKNWIITFRCTEKEIRFTSKALER